MPFYEYKCQRCDYHFTTYQSIKADPLELCGIHCPIQDLGTVKRLISKNVYVIFKGKGFYETDYRRKEEKK